jgi:sarcosine oxidase
VTYDAIVVGLGGMGSATLYHLASRGLRVLGLEQFAIPHALGSSHGLTRIIRLAYHESPAYVPLLRRSYELWDRLQREAGEPLLHVTGSIDAGWDGSRTVSGALAACHEHDLAFELLTAAQLHARYPGYELPAGMTVLLQPQGGLLVPERCVVAHVEGARRAGATVAENQRVLDWDASPAGARVRTATGTHAAARLVVTAGPWARTLVPALSELAVPERQVVMWTAVEDESLFTPDRFPVFNLQASRDDSEHYYGFPLHGRRGFKVGRYHHRKEHGRPEDLRRQTDAADEEMLRVALRRFFPKANGPALALETCLFTNSPDGHFILDRLDGLPNVAVAAGFSGHGFKFCSVIGEIMADLVTEGQSPLDLRMFSADRFSRPPVIE